MYYIYLYVFVLERFQDHIIHYKDSTLVTALSSFKSTHSVIKFTDYMWKLTSRLSFCVLSRNIGGPESDESFKGGLSSLTYRLGGIENVTVEVNNVLVNKEIHNVFGVIKGFTDPGRAQLFFSSTVGFFIVQLDINNVFWCLDVIIQIVTLYWELRETPGGKATPRQLLVPPFCWSWPELLKRWWRKVTDIRLFILRKQGLNKAFFFTQ